MKHLRNSGFTVIETMLFLGVTGFLIIGLMVGTSTQISTQRYRDAVSSFQVELQQLYADVESVRNDRVGTAGCGGATSQRGQSDCILVGKLASIDTDGTMRSVDVRAERRSDISGSDLMVLQNGYTYSVYAPSQETNPMPWGTTATWPQQGAGSQADPDAAAPDSMSGAARTISLLILRSPVTGFVYTFTRDSLPASTADHAFLSAMIRDNHEGDTFGRQQRILCIAPRGLVVAERMAVIIRQNASNGNAIETLSNEGLQSILGVTTRC